MESTKTCPNCGYQVELNKPFCPNCGSKFEAAQVIPMVTETEETLRMEASAAGSTAIRCTRCGARISSPDGICASCGNVVEIPVVASISEATNKCPVCGNEVPRANKFCNRCGADMNKLTEREEFMRKAPDKPNPFMESGGTGGAGVTTSCRFCGSPMNSNAGFCPKCGNANQPESAYSCAPNLPQTPTNTNSGLVYGILAIVFGILGGWLAIAFGIMGINAAKKSGNTATMVCSIIGLCLIPLSFIFQLGLAMM